MILKRRSEILVAALVVGAVAIPAAASPIDDLRAWWFGQPWAFMESVGGIRAGDAARGEHGGVAIALDCDVSGLRSITREPEGLHSGLGVAAVFAEAEADAVLVSIRTGVGGSSSCPPARIAKLAAGSYRVFYLGADRERHEIGQVKVP